MSVVEGRHLAVHLLSPFFTSHFCFLLSIFCFFAMHWMWKVSEWHAGQSGERLAHWMCFYAQNHATALHFALQRADQPAKEFRGQACHDGTFVFRSNWTGVLGKNKK